MTVRKRIALLIALTGFVTNILFSIVIFFELMEQPFDILDDELREEALLTINLKLADKDGAVLGAYMLQDRELHPYWMKIYDIKTGKLFYQSDLAKATVIPAEKIKDKSITRLMPLSGESINDKDFYRVGVFLMNVGMQTFNVEIAKPMGELYDEIKELLFSIIAGLVFSCLALIVISYFIAGKILQPVRDIQLLAQEIGDKNLGSRIPVGDDNDEFSSLTITINKMLDRLQNAFIRQRNLLFDTSHELKTPLTAMRLAIDNFCDVDAGNMEIDVKDNFLQLKDQVLRMDHLIKDLLNLSAMETLGTVDCEQADIADILKLLLEDYSLFASVKNIHIKNNIDMALPVCADIAKLTRAFSNILDNAIKYNKDNGEIIINCERNNDNVTVSVVNTGVGIDLDSSKKVFEQFYRGEQSRSTEYGGAGLGLTMVKRIIELHNGTVGFESKVDDVTIVTVCLPVYKG